MTRRLLLLGALLIVVLLVIGVVLFARARPEVVGGARAPSGGGAWYEVYFTDPKYPDRPENRHGGIDERFVAFLDDARRGLDVAIYDFDLPNAADALVRAKQRGVNVRVVMDTDTLNNTRDEHIQAAVNKLKAANIPIVPDERSAIMHHKFVVRDGEEVWTGSWNFTTGDTYRLNNNAARLRSPQLAANYAGEFRKLFEARQFGPNKPAGVPNRTISIDGARVETLFAPQDDVADHIVQRLRQARQSIRFLAFSFTHDGIAEALLDRARAGVNVVGIFERTGSETRFSEFGRLKEAGVEVYQDGNRYAMHHKVFIIDDRTVMFGSFNFSDGADKSNDENLLVVEDPAFARLFIQEFDRMLAAAKNPPARREGTSRERPR
jgi:phosphatidylserine/phosphatidylglycerophosphate/cardiolipin synthase-like enzyme